MKNEEVYSAASFCKISQNMFSAKTRALDKKEYLMIIFLISYRNHIL